MKITVAAIGTRGDVQPMIALGKGLRDAGHEVTLIAGSNFASWVADHDLAFVPTVDIEALMSSEKGVAWSESGDNPLRAVRMMRSLMDESGPAMVEPVDRCARSTDFLVGSFSAQPLVQSVSERTGVPCVHAMLQPQIPTKSGAASLAPLFPKRASVLNRWLGALTERVLWSVASRTTNTYRKRVGLGPHSPRSFVRANRRIRALLGFSEHVVPRPDDWPDSASITGFWFLDEEDPPSAALEAFVDAGDPPVAIGFGSMSSRDPRGTLAMIVDAVRRSGRRAVVIAGRGDLAADSLPREVCLVRSAPHGWLFPRVAGVVHHGGAGTTAAALRAGRPATIVPHMSDQPYWGRRVHEIGAGTRPLPRHRLTARALAAALAELVDDTRIRARAEELGAKIRAERGVATAVATLERYPRPPAGLHSAA